MYSHHKHLSPQERILNSLADEQQSLAKILRFLAIKVEKTVEWLPDSLPDETPSEIVEKVKCLEAVIAQEICATASKEQAIQAVLQQICKNESDHCHKKCPCPCRDYHVCKIVGYCVKEHH